MRNIFLRIAYAAGLFLAVFIVLEIFAGGSGAQTTEEMAEPVLPVVSVQSSSGTFNLLHGHTGETDPGQMRPVLTPVSSDRTISIVVNPYGTAVHSAKAEARDITGQRLIEQEDLELSQDESGLVHADIAFSNLIEADTEYMLVVVLQIQQNTETAGSVRYYTRFVSSGDEDALTEAEEALSFALEFHHDTFDKTSQDALLTWLEPDTSEANDSLQHVTIQSSADQVTWGDLDPVPLTEPVYSITDIQNGIYGIRGVFYLQTSPAEEDGTDTARIFRAEEYYELRKGTDRFYLMNYERTMTQVFNPQSPAGSDGALDLGIVDPEITAVQSDNRDTTAFVLDGDLYAVQNSAKMLAYVYGFRSTDSQDERETYSAHDILIESVSDDGSIDFIVYGYMNAGRHEGESGVSFLHYSGDHHTVEEKAFVPVEAGWEHLRYRTRQESYYNAAEGVLYLILDDGLYGVDVNACSIRLVLGQLAERKAVISESGRMAACEEMENGEATGNAVLLNLETGKETVLSGENGRSVIPLGFIGEDLIYGTLNSSDIVRDSAGISLEPMDHVYIVDAEQNVLEDYHRDGYYVTGVKVEEGQVTLLRVQRTGGTSTYSRAADDQIVSGLPGQTDSCVSTGYESRYQTTVQLQTGETETASLRYIRPEEILYEGSRELVVRTESGESGEKETGALEYYAFDCSGLMDSNYNIADVISEADTSSTGIVTDGNGRYVWRGSGPERSEIDALTVMESGTAMRNSLTVCLENMLSVEKISADVEAQLEEGESAVQILEGAMSGAAVLDLTGCSMEEVLYYVGLHHPVLAMTESGNAVLVVGYGPENVELYDPAAGSVYLLNRDTAQSRFQTAGNRFISYVASK